MLPPSPVFIHAPFPGKYLQFFLLGSSTATSSGKVKGRSAEASCLLKSTGSTDRVGGGEEIGKEGGCKFPNNQCDPISAYETLAETLYIHSPYSLMLIKASVAPLGKERQLTRAVLYSYVLINTSIILIKIATLDFSIILCLPLPPVVKKNEGKHTEQKPFF